MGWVSIFAPPCFVTRLTCVRGLDCRFHPRFCCHLQRCEWGCWCLPACPQLAWFYRRWPRNSCSATITNASRSLLVSTAAAAAFAWNAGVVTRPSTPNRLDTAFAWFKRFNSLSPLTTGLNVFRIVCPQCVQLMQSGNFEALSSKTDRNLLGERGRGGHSRPLKWGESRAHRRGRRHDVYCWHVFVNRGILVRLVMHLFWGEKYKDLWFYTLFYIFILYLYSSWWK